MAIEVVLPRLNSYLFFFLFLKTDKIKATFIYWLFLRSISFFELSVTPLNYAFFILFSYSFLLFFSPILFSYSILLFFSPILFSYSILLFYTPILFSYSFLLFYTPILYSYSILLLLFYDFYLLTALQFIHFNNTFIHYKKTLTIGG